MDGSKSDVLRISAASGGLARSGEIMDGSKSDVRRISAASGGLARAASVLAAIVPLVLASPAPAIAQASTPPVPSVAIHVSEVTGALESMPATAPTPMGPGTTGYQWWNPAWHYFVMPEALKEALRSDGTPFAVVSDADISAGRLLTADGSPKYPIVITLAAEAVRDDEIGPLRNYVAAGGFLFVGSSALTRRPDGTARGDGALANEMGLHAATPDMANWYQNARYTKLVDQRLTSHIPGPGGYWRLPGSSEQIPWGVYPSYQDNQSHLVWQVHATDAQVLLADGSGGPLLATKGYGSGRFIFFGPMQPLIAHGGYEVGMYSYVVFRRAIEWAFEATSIPVIRLSPWQYPNDAAVVVRHDLENYATTIANSIETSAQWEKSHGVKGDYYFSTGVLRQGSGDTQLTPDQKTAGVNSIRRAISLYGATVGSHNGGLPNPATPLPSADYHYWHWGPDEALDTVQPGYASGSDYAQASLRASFQDIEGWFAGLDNGRPGCGLNSSCPRTWVSPFFNGTREGSVTILEQLGAVTAGEQKVSPYPHWIVSTQTIGKRFSQVSLPTSEWYSPVAGTSDNDVLQALDYHTSASLDQAVDFYYGLGALINFYTHRATTDSFLAQHYIDYAASKPRTWATNATGVYDWWRVRSPVVVTPGYTGSGTAASATATVSGATDPDTAIEIALPGTATNLQVFLNGTAADPSAWRATSYGVKVRVGASVSAVEVRYATVPPPPGCTYSISPTARSFGPAGGNGSIDVMATTGCPWTAVSSAPWITVTSSSTGSGNASVTYSVAQGPIDARTGTVTIAGQTLAITQQGTVVTINLWEAAHQDPVLPLTTDASTLSATDGQWHNFWWQCCRAYPSVVGAAGELLPVMRFYATGIPDGIYDVRAKLYTNVAGRDMRYFYGYQPNATAAYHVDTVGGSGVGGEDFTEYSLGAVDLTGGIFNIYAQSATLLSGSYPYFAWATIRLLPETPAASLSQIAVTPANPVVAPGTSQQFVAAGTYSDGSTQNITGQVTWASSANMVATISAAGLATAAMAGTTGITATLGGVAGSTTLTVPLGLSSVTLNPSSVLGGSMSTGTVTLNGPAPSGGVTVAISSSSPAVASVPASIALAAGATSATFPVTSFSVAAPTSVTISASYGGVGGSAMLTVTPVSVSAVTLSPNAAVEGGTSTGTVTLSAAAPVDTAVTLSSSGAAAMVPPSVVVPAGATSATFGLATGVVTATTSVTITASYGGTSRTATLSVRALTVTLSPTSVVGGSGSTGTLTLSASMATPTTVALSSSNPAAAVPASATIAAGATTATFAVTTSPVTAITAVTISATNGTVTSTGALSVSPVVPSNLALSPTTVVEGGTSTGTVTLSAAAPVDTAVALSSSGAAAMVPPSVVVPAGATSATFGLATGVVTATTSVTITASYGGTSRTATLSVRALTVTLSPTSVVGGSGSTGTLTLSASMATPTTVALSSSSPAAAVPASATIAAGATTATFAVTTSPVTATTAVTVSATNGTVTSTGALTLSAAVPSTVTLRPTAVVEGDPSTGTVTLTGVAPAGGTTVALSSNNAAATVPASVLVPGGAASATFPIATRAVSSGTSVTITAQSGGVSRAATLAIRALTVSLSPATVGGGNASTATVRLSSTVAVATTATLTTSNPVVATVPPTVTIPAGATTATFPVTTTAVTATTAVAVTVTYAGIPVSANLSVRVISPSSVSLAPSSVVGGVPSIGTVNLNYAAPSGGYVVTLASSRPAVATVPVSVSVPAGATRATFTVRSYPVASNTSSSISVSGGGVTRSATLTVTAPAVTGLTLNPSTVTSGTTSVGTVTLTGAAPSAGCSVTLTSNAISVATAPASVIVPAGATSAMFTATAGTVGVTSSATLSAAAGGGTATATLTVNP